MSFANTYARTMTRHLLASVLARFEGSTIRMETRYLQRVSRDDLIADLGMTIRAEAAHGRRAPNAIRGAYIRERHARLIDRAMVRAWALEEPEHAPLGGFWGENV